ncbi:GNAT family N-acetyltransferase [Algiphilus sp. W345]|uniref:GNAT family N-acetyltransferase n=1 Tax=Banduia mediterranea TaxID=3075609 RepID=A0ABU2WK21_9GAMM|nr:GNAT family N-acetyltransferase [Algiphilus sp. W345]MDT0498228.1 GNAT family N-acetyltransferase [Algiphilus sp. W345]
MGADAVTSSAGAGGVLEWVRDTAFLRSQRLQLSPLRARDAAGLLELDRSDLVGRWLLDDRLQNLLQAHVLVDWMNGFYAQNPGLGVWAARDRQDRFVGIYSLMPVPDTEDVEIGARLLPAHWNGGLAVEMGHQLCRHAFTTLALPRLVSFCDLRHESVPAVLRRLGFRPAGTAKHFGKTALFFEQNKTHWSDHHQS